MTWLGSALRFRQCAPKRPASPPHRPQHRRAVPKFTAPSYSTYASNIDIFSHFSLFHNFEFTPERLPCRCCTLAHSFLSHLLIVFPINVLRSLSFSDCVPSEVLPLVSRLLPCSSTFVILTVTRRSCVFASRVT